MLYSLDNPSDNYIFEAENREVAALTVLYLSPAYGATAQIDDEYNNVPIFILGDAREWYEATFGRTTDEGLDALKKEVATSLSSFMLGDFEDWRRYQAALNAITDDKKREEFIAEWQDGHSSLTDIGTCAHKLGKRLLDNDDLDLEDC